MIRNISSGATGSPVGIITGLVNDGLYGFSSNSNLHGSNLGGSPFIDFSQYALCRGTLVLFNSSDSLVGSRLLVAGGLAVSWALSVFFFQRGK